MVRHDITEPYYAELDEIYNLVYLDFLFIINFILLK